MIGRVGPRDDSSQELGAFAEAPDERARMGRISGLLWMVAAAGRRRSPPSSPAPCTRRSPGCSALSVARLPLRPRQRHRRDPLAARLDERAGDRHGGDDPGRRPRPLPHRRLAQLHRAAAGLLAALRRLLLPRPLGLAALDRADPGRRHAAALRRARDRQRLPAALPGAGRRLPRGDLGDGRAQTPPGRRRGAPARHRQPRPADRGRQPPRLRRDPAPRAGGPDRSHAAAAARPTTARSPC